MRWGLGLCLGAIFYFLAKCFYKYKKLGAPGEMGEGLFWGEIKERRKEILRMHEEEVLEKHRYGLETKTMSMYSLPAPYGEEIRPLLV